MISYEDFTKPDIRVGQIIEAEDLPKARNPSFKLTINFGATLGERISCAQLTENYTPQKLVGMLVLGVVNLPPMRIAGVESTVLTLGAKDEAGHCVLATVERDAVVGGQIY